MSFWERLKATRKKKEAERLVDRALEQAEQRVIAEGGPLRELGRCIIIAAEKCWRRVMNQETLGTEPSATDMAVSCEFLYFFLYLTMREAARQRFTGGETERLQEYVGPGMAAATVERFCAHWPENLKERMQGEFYDKLNAAGVEYTKCRDPNSLLAMLGRNVNEAALTGSHSQSEPITLSLSQGTAAECLVEMRLRDRLASVRELLHW